MSQPLLPPDPTSAPTGFVCSWKTDGVDAAWVHVGGDLDLSTAPQLKQTLREAQLEARLVVLDLRELSFMDSSGVHAMVDASHRARKAGRRLVLLRGPPHVDRTFELTGTIGDVEITDLAPGEPPVQVLLQLAERDRSRV